MSALAAAGLLAALSWPLAAAPAPVRPAAPPPDRELVVGIYEAPPWAMKGPGGQWRGLTVDLWKQIASGAGLRYRFQQAPPDAILDGIARGTLDTSAGPFADTLALERRMDFSNTYAITGVSIAVRRRRDEDRWIAVLEALTRPTALRLYVAAAGLTFFAGAALWALERRRNAMFSPGMLRGVGAGFWWAGVTTVGVGYGDKVPITFWGRVVALFWMCISLILITALTAFVTATLAVGELGRIHGVAGLDGTMSAAVEGSASTEFLRRERLPYRLYPSGPDALAALLRNDVKAVVYDDTTLRYYADRDPRKRIDVVPGTLEPQTYAFPLPDGSVYRDRLNAALRRVMNEPHWPDLRDRYLSEDGAAGSH